MWVILLYTRVQLHHIKSGSYKNKINSDFEISYTIYIDLEFFELFYHNLIWNLLQNEIFLILKFWYLHKLTIKLVCKNCTIYFCHKLWEIQNTSWSFWFLNRSNNVLENTAHYIHSLVSTEHHFFSPNRIQTNSKVPHYERFDSNGSLV